MTDARLSQEVLEHWATTNVAAAGPQMAATQVAIEHWASVAEASTSQTRAWIMA